jgi:hypothetical protein
MNRIVETMCRQHDELRALASEYFRQLDRAAPDLQALSKCRWTLARLLSGHLAYEGAHLYPALSAQGGRSQHVGAAMGAEAAKLASTLQNHVREWTASAILNDWDAYRTTSRSLIEILVARLDAEEAELYPLALLAKAA